jgi:outer membrane receptor protein involved in Fe transport
MLLAAPANAQTGAAPPEDAANAGQADDAEPQSSRTADGELFSNEIVVTASRRAERLQNVPSAITALEGSTLEAIGAQTFRDYSTLIPGLSQRDLGNPGQGTIIIRGLNTGPQSITNTAATYIDEAPFSASGFLSAGAILTPDPDIADLDRIEVLKGPQGTLYGANSLGGLIRIITTRPDASRFSGRVWGEATTVDGGDTGYAVRGSVNVPLVTDRLPRMMAVSAAFAVFSGVAGLYASYYLNVASGAAIVIACTACFAAASVVRVVRRSFGTKKAGAGQDNAFRGVTHAE